MDLGLEGRKAIITGGSRGIGRAITQRLLAEGAEVCIAARGVEGVESAVAELSANGTVHGSSVDARDSEAVAAWVSECAERMGGIDIVISNASGGGAGQTTAKAFQRTLDVDVMSLVTMVETAAPQLEASDAAAVLAISTTAALEHFGDGIGAYNALKAGVINLMAGYSQSLGSKGIRANTVSPGPIWVDGGGWNQIKDAMPDMYDATAAGHPSGRLGTAAEVANAAAFLVSPAASWVTGTNLVVDGGFTKRVNF